MLVRTRRPGVPRHPDARRAQERGAEHVSSAAFLEDQSVARGIVRLLHRDRFGHGGVEALSHQVEPLNSLGREGLEEMITDERDAGQEAAGTRGSGADRDRPVEVIEDPEHLAHHLDARDLDPALQIARQAHPEGLALLLDPAVGRADLPRPALRLLGADLQLLDDRGVARLQGRRGLVLEDRTSIDDRECLILAVVPRVS